MKLLLTTDFPTIYPDVFQPIAHHLYQFKSIQIAYFYLPDELKMLEEYSSIHRFHLCLSLTEAEIICPNLPPATAYNSVRNFANNSNESYINKTTSYFNVFLPIPKCLSYPTHFPEMPSSLAAVSPFNHSLANIWSTQKANYYTLIYPKNQPTEDSKNFLIDLLTKIE